MRHSCCAQCVRGYMMSMRQESGMHVTCGALTLPMYELWHMPIPAVAATHRPQSFCLPPLQHPDLWSSSDRWQSLPLSSAIRYLQ